MKLPQPIFGIEPLEARIAPATFLVTNTLDSGPGSLRQAILDANASTGTDSVSISLPNLSIIQLKSVLPAITETLHIAPTLTSSRIGLDGSMAIGQSGVNLGSGLVLLGSASSNSSIKGLAIYGFDIAGIEIVDSSSNRISGNYLGLNVFGNLTTFRMAAGVLVNDGSANQIGFGQAGNSIGGNDVGVRITGGADNTVVDYNWIGVTNSSTYSSARSNDTGILVESATKTQIGALGGNTIAGNQSFGIKLAASATNTTIFRNKIGSPTLSPATWTGTQEWGIFIDGANATTIGSGTYQPRPGQGNEISGNSAGGIWIRTGSGPGTTQIAGNIIGIGSSENVSRHYENGGPGILVTTRLDGETFPPQSLQISSNLISGNVGAGIELRCFGRSQPTTIDGNLIGADLRGTAPIGNAAGIIVDGTDAVTIGAKTANTIVASGQEGILIKNSTNVTVLNSNIGFSSFLPNSSEFANGGDGIRLLEVGLVKISGNQIFHNGGDGIFLDGKIPGNRGLTPNVSITGNGIGTHPKFSGTTTNAGSGIHILEANADFQNPKPGVITIADNWVHAAFDDGIVVERSLGVQISDNDVVASGAALRLTNAAKTLVVGNDLLSLNDDGVILDQGTFETVFGTLEQGNRVEGKTTGLSIEAGSNNTVTGNVIRGMTVGIEIESGENNLISRNSFVVGDHGQLVDLGGDGVTPNDSLDADLGPNTLLNSPLLVSAAVTGGQTLLRGEYRGAANSDVRIEWHVNGVFFTEVNVHTDENGIAKLSLDFDQELPAGSSISASASIGLNTSEFSNHVEATVPPEVTVKGAAPGQKPLVQLRDAITGDVMLDHLAFGKSMLKGVKVATADVDGDGFTDLIATPRSGNGVVKVFSGLDGREIVRFSTSSNGQSIRSIAAGDLDGDGTIEVVVGQALKMGGPVSVYDALTGALEQRLTPFGFNTPDRLKLSLQDVDGDALPEIVVRAEIFGGSKKIVLDPISGHVERLARVVRG